MGIQADLIADLEPRYVTLEYTCVFMGMNKNFFNSEVRPNLREYRFGRSVRFDRLDIEDWIEQNIQRYECPGKFFGEKSWDKRKRQASLREVASGTSTKRSTVSAFNAALEQAALKKQKRS
jgi:predicted DNA-binding transcriptional regulator AlpA